MIINKLPQGGGIKFLGNATVNDVLNGKTFYSNSKNLLTGTFQEQFEDITSKCAVITSTKQFVLPTGYSANKIISIDICSTLSPIDMHGEIRTTYNYLKTIVTQYLYGIYSSSPSISSNIKDNVSNVIALTVQSGRDLSQFVFFNVIYKKY